MMETFTNKTRRIAQLLICAALITYHLSFLTSCTQDAYEKGEGDYSLMRGDFAEANINAAKEIVSVTTDDGDQLALRQPKKADWVIRPDTTYRCMAYYNKVADADGKRLADIISIGKVPCVGITPLPDFTKAVKTDPVKFRSVWMSKSGKYLNLSLQLMTGQTDDSTAVHRLSFLSDSLEVTPTQTRILHVFLAHDQNNVPEYYSTQAYISIPTDSIPADSIHLRINTYEGLFVKTLKVPQIRWK